MTTILATTDESIEKLLYRIISCLNEFERASAPNVGVKSLIHKLRQITNVEKKAKFNFIFSFRIEIVHTS